MENDGEQISFDQQRRMMLDILDKLSVYCEKYHLKYCLIAGTLLGAVRHHGYIPWDDDVDIAMPSQDYFRLIELTKTDPVAPEIMISSVYTNPDHLWPMAKAFLTTTRLTEPALLDKYRKQQEQYGGIYVDIFPLYGIPDEPREKERFCQRIDRLYSHYKHATRKVRFKKNYGSMLRKAVYQIAFIPDRLLGGPFFLKRLSALAEQYPFGSTRDVAFSFGIVKKGRDISPCDAYAEMKDAPFENLKLKIPVRYNEILTRHYGNYMQLPPESERRTHTHNMTYRTEKDGRKTVC